MKIKAPFAIKCRTDRFSVKYVRVQVIGYKGLSYHAPRQLTAQNAKSGVRFLAIDLLCENKYSQKHIAAICGVSRARIAQIQRRYCI